MSNRDYENYDYIHSESLNMDIAYKKDRSVLFTEDGVKYTAKELDILYDTLDGGKVTPYIHNMKKKFKGEIVNANTN